MIAANSADKACKRDMLAYVACLAQTDPGDSPSQEGTRGYFGIRDGYGFGEVVRRTIPESGGENRNLSDVGDMIT